MQTINEIIDSNVDHSSSNVYRMCNLHGCAVIYRYIEKRRLSRGERERERARNSISRAWLLNIQSDAGSEMATIKHRFPWWNEPTERKAIRSISWREMCVCKGVGEKCGVKIWSCSLKNRKCFATGFLLVWEAIITGDQRATSRPPHTHDSLCAD